MRIFKYIIFLSTLIGIFFIIYKQSDEKGVDRWRNSFKRAIFFSALAADLIPINLKVIESNVNNNPVYQERSVSDQEFNSFEENDQKTILVNTGGQPSDFPTPLSGNQANRPVYIRQPSRPVYVPKYRTTPKAANKGFDPGGNPNPAGGFGGSEFDDQCPTPEKQQKSDINDFQSNISKSKKKKQETDQDQCELNENITYKINEKFESNAVKKLVKTALDTDRVKQEYEGIKKRLKEGVNPLDIGKKTTRVSSDKILIKGSHGRYLVEISGDQVNILGIGARANTRNMHNFRDLMNKKYDLNLRYKN